MNLQHEWALLRYNCTLQRLLYSTYLQSTTERQKLGLLYNWKILQLLYVGKTRILFFISSCRENRKISLLFVFMVSLYIYHRKCPEKELSKGRPGIWWNVFVFLFVCCLCRCLCILSLDMYHRQCPEEKLTRDGQTSGEMSLSLYVVFVFVFVCCLWILSLYIYHRKCPEKELTREHPDIWWNVCLSLSIRPRQKDNLQWMYVPYSFLP